MSANDNFDAEAYRRWVDEEFRAFRRKKRLDLEWARVSYGVALLVGAAIAFDEHPVWYGLLGLWAAFAGAWFLDRHLVAEVVERSVR